MEPPGNIGAATSHSQQQHKGIPRPEAEIFSQPAVETAAGSNTNTKPVHQLPDYKDQARQSGQEAGGDSTIVPLALSVHAVVEYDEDPEDPRTVLAAVLQTVPSSINAKNTVGTIEREPNIIANANNNSSIPDSISADTSSLPTGTAGGEVNGQNIVLRKHIMIWAGSFVVAAVAIAVALVIAGNGGSTVEKPSTSSSLPAPPTNEPFTEPSPAPTPSSAPLDGTALPNVGGSDGGTAVETAGAAAGA